MSKNLKKSMLVILSVSLTSTFPRLSVAAVSQQPVSQAAAVIDAEGQYRSTLIIFTDDVQVAKLKYYWWRGNCYIRNASGDYEILPDAPCN